MLKLLRVDPVHGAFGSCPRCMWILPTVHVDLAQWILPTVHVDPAHGACGSCPWCMWILPTVHVDFAQWTLPTVHVDPAHGACGFCPWCMTKVEQWNGVKLPGSGEDWSVDRRWTGVLALPVTLNLHSLRSPDSHFKATMLCRSAADP